MSMIHTSRNSEEIEKLKKVNKIVKTFHQSDVNFDQPIKQRWFGLSPANPGENFGHPYEFKRLEKKNSVDSDVSDSQKGNKIPTFEELQQQR